MSEVKYIRTPNIVAPIPLLVLCLLVPHVRAIDEKIVGGVPATVTRVPYLVNLRERGNLICGGSLVSPRHVVTAAHCVYNKRPRSINVVGGATYRFQRSNVRQVIRAYLPSNYNSTSLHNDVAVLLLNRALTGSNISTIGLCSANVTAGDVVHVSGWGKRRESSRRMSWQIHTMYVQVIRTDVCVRDYKNQGPVTNSMFCAGNNNQKGICNGDSGGPLVYNNQLCGIVSWSLGCARIGYPNVFTNVFAVRSFILRNIRRT